MFLQNNLSTLEINESLGILKLSLPSEARGEFRKTGIWSGVSLSPHSPPTPVKLET